MHEEHGHSLFGKNIREIIFGIEDGLVSIFGAVIGLAIGSSSSSVVVLGGLAAAISGAISMAAGTYLSSKSEQEWIEKERKTELKEIKKHPEEYRKEVKNILKDRGFDGKTLDEMVKTLCEDEKLCAKMILEHEGIYSQRSDSPIKDSGAMFFAYLFATVFPVLPYILFPLNTAMIVSGVATIVALFGFGASKQAFTERKWYWSGLEMLLVGTIAGLAGFVIGQLFGVGIV